MISIIGLIVIVAGVVIEYFKNPLINKKSIRMPLGTGGTGG